jgi:hypothetical protein
MTSVKSVQCITSICFLLLMGCTHRVPQATVEVIDTSLSITPRAEKAALDAVQNQIVQMQRGDILVLIPITGDATNDAGGRVIRLSAPTVRETYDTDLRRFQVQARKQVEVWTTSFVQHQSRTDILGALDAARQELAALPNGMNRKLIVVSDFLEDDGAYRFVSAKELASSTAGQELAVRLHSQHGFALRGIPLCLGRLESTDFVSLSFQRREAVQAFWMAYFEAGGLPVEIQFDGTGILADTEHRCAVGSQ